MVSSIGVRHRPMEYTGRQRGCSTPLWTHVSNSLRVKNSRRVGDAVLNFLLPDSLRTPGLGCCPAYLSLTNHG